jgi:uncharacterized small protein (DUF1192 family)
MITASPDTLLRQATMTSETYYRDLLYRFKDENVPPEVMAAMINAASIDFAAATIAISVQELTETIQLLPDEIRELYADDHEDFS